MAQVTTLNQRDPRWASHPLGNVTIGTDGCLVTSIASILNLDPIQVVDRIAAVGGFLNGSLVIWDKLPAAFPGMQVHRVWSYDDALANSQHPTLLEVDFDGTPRTDDKHWVVLINKDTIMDPWTGTIDSSSKYPLKTGFCLVTPPADIEHTNYYKGLDLTNAESMKVAIDTWERVKNGELVDKAQYQSQADAATQCQTQLKTALDQVSEFQRKEAELERALTSVKAQLKEVQSKYEDEQKLVLSLKAEIEEIHKQDKDFGQEALDAQHKYNTLKEGIERVGQEMDIQYNPSDDKALVETILKEINNREQTALPQNQNAQLQNIIRQFESLGINNFLTKRGLPPVSTSQVDQNLEEKVALYLTEFVSEHLALDKRVNELEQLLNIPASNPDQATPIINSIKKTSESAIIKVLKKILGPILVQPV